MTTFNIVRKRSNFIHQDLRFHFDYWLLLAIAGLVVVGMLMVYSTTFDIGLLFKDDSGYYFRRQLGALILGLLGMIFIFPFDYHILRRVSVPFLGVTLIALLFVLLFGEALLC